MNIREKKKRKNKRNHDKNSGGSGEEECVWLFPTLFLRLYLTEVFHSSGSSPEEVFCLFSWSMSLLKAGWQDIYSGPNPWYTTALCECPVRVSCFTNFCELFTPLKHSASPREPTACFAVFTLPTPISYFCLQCHKNLPLKKSSSRLVVLTAALEKRTQPAQRNTLLFRP